MTGVVRPNAEPNVTPRIDVLLVLLIVFMVVVVQGRRTMDVQLPDACQGRCDGGEAIVLEVLPGGAYRLNQRALSHPELQAALGSSGNFGIAWCAWSGPREAWASLRESPPVLHPDDPQTGTVGRLFRTA